MLNLVWSLYCMLCRAGHIALWNRSFALRSWANLDFGSDGAPWDKERSALSGLTKSRSERSALEWFKEKRAPSFKERFQWSNRWNRHKMWRFIHILIKNTRAANKYVNKYKNVYWHSFDMIFLCHLCITLHYYTEIAGAGGRNNLFVLAVAGGVGLRYRYVLIWVPVAQFFPAD